MTAQVPPIAGRADLTVTAAPGAGHGHAACFTPANATIEIKGSHLPVDPATADPARPSDRERYPAMWGAVIHECAHAAHTGWQPPKGTSPAWAEAAMALEESRIEHNQLTRRRRAPRQHRRSRLLRRADPRPRRRRHPRARRVRPRRAGRHLPHRPGQDEAA